MAARGRAKVFARLRLAVRGAIAAVAVSAVAVPGAHAVDPAGSVGAGILSVVNQSADSTQVTGWVWPAQTDGLTYSVFYGLEDSAFCQSGGLDYQSASDGFQATPDTAVGTQDMTFQVVLSGLAPGSEYCAETYALNGDTVVAQSVGLSLWTAGTPNVTVDRDATIAGASSDRLSASVDPAGQPASYQFEWAPRSSTWCRSGGASGSPTPMPAAAVPAGDSFASVTGTLSGLTPGQYYCAGMSVTNATGTTTVVSMGDTALGFMAGVPSIRTGAASQITASSARLGYTVDTDLDPGAEVYLEWRPARQGGCRGLASDRSPRTFQYADASLAGRAGNHTGWLSTRAFAATDPSVLLAPRTRYCYVAVLASNEPNGFEQSRYAGRVRYFTTPSAPSG